MNTEIFTDKASMTSIEIAELVGSRPDSVKRTIETLAKKGNHPISTDCGN